MINDTIVGVINAGTLNYEAAENLFRPSSKYPEYIFEEISPKRNQIYEAVRESLIKTGLDKKNLGSSNWNPFGEFIHPEDTVLIKPNMVQDFNCNKQGGVGCLYTQPSVVAPVIDYVFKALGGTGKVVVGDAPMQICNFKKLITQTGYDKLIEYYQKKGLNIELIDFRKETTTVKHRIANRNENNAPFVGVNLGVESEFAGIPPENAKKLRIVNYPHNDLIKHHHDNIHEYCISKHVLDADVIINMPKPKTHKKAGVTISLKNLVGINARKEYLPHHTFGSKEEGGDEYKKKSRLQNLRSKLYDKKYMFEDQHKLFYAQIVWFAIAFCTIILRLSKTKYENGSWYGNETISKTIVDLNKIILYADKTGIMRDEPQRRYFIVADMIICGEKDGPVSPSPKPIGYIAVGSNPVYFDQTIATLMGCDINKIPTFRQIFNSKSKYKIFDKNKEGVIFSNNNELDGKTYQQIQSNCLWNFVAPDGWKGHIEK